MLQFAGRKLIIKLTTNRTICFRGLTTNLIFFYSDKAFVGDFRFPIRRCFGSAGMNLQRLFSFLNFMANVSELLKEAAEKLKRDEKGVTKFPGWNYALNPESETKGRQIETVCAGIAYHDDVWEIGHDIKHTDLAVLLDYIADML